MRKLLTALAIGFLFTACQKEVSFDENNPGNTGSTGGNNNPGGGGGTGSTDGLLVKTVTVLGSETQTTLYTYDAQKRLETMTMSGTSGGLPINNFSKYIRDNAGRIVMVKQVLQAPMPGVTVDTATTVYHYPNATTQNYDYSVYVITMDMGGMSMSTIDSAVYHYSAAGRMTSFDKYMSSSLMPGMIQMTSRYDFVYDGSDRVTTMTLFTDTNNPGGTLEQDVQWKYTYATTSVNNVYATGSPAQNFALNGLPNTTASIVTKMETNSQSTSPPLNVVATFTYVNGANNKPVSGTSVVTTTGQPTQTTKYTFYYQ